jgi:hypothetical protein
MRKALVAAAVLALAGCAQMMPGGGTRAPVTLSGAEEVPPVSTQGSGKGEFVVAPDGTVTGSVTTTGVPGLVAHIHQGAPGANGPVIIPLTKDGDTYRAPPGAKLIEAQMQAFKAGNLYVNVHTAQHKGGEVRGQLRSGGAARSY